MAIVLSLPKPGEVVKRGLPPTPSPPPAEPGGLCLTQISRAGQQKCHTWPMGKKGPGGRKGQAGKMKGMSDEMLICFGKQVAVATTRGLWGFVRLRQGWKSRDQGGARPGSLCDWFPSLSPSPGLCHLILEGSQMALCLNSGLAASVAV